MQLVNSFSLLPGCFLSLNTVIRYTFQSTDAELYDARLGSPFCLGDVCWRLEMVSECAILWHSFSLLGTHSLMLAEWWLIVGLLVRKISFLCNTLFYTFLSYIKRTLLFGYLFYIYFNENMLLLFCFHAFHLCLLFVSFCLIWFLFMWFSFFLHLYIHRATFSVVSLRIERAYVKSLILQRDTVKPKVKQRSANLNDPLYDN